MILNPFAKHDVSEFPGVLIPLDQAHHRASVISANKKEVDASLARDAPSSYEGGITLDELRVEVESDVAASGHDSAYDRKTSFPTSSLV